MTSKPTYEELEQRVKDLERKVPEANRAQEMLEEVQNLFNLLESAPHGIFLIDLFGKIIFANETGADRLGKTSKEIIGTALKDYFPPDIAGKRRLKGIEALNSGKLQRIEDQVGDL